MPNYKDPYVEITVDGVPWSQATHGGVIDSVEIIDEDGAFLTAKVDVAGLTVNEMGSSAFRAGVVMNIRLGYSPDNMYDWGSFKMMKPTYNFGPQRTCSVMLQGQSGGSGAPMAHAEVHETWNNKTIREIVTELADRYGFNIYFGKYDDPPVLKGMLGVIFKKVRVLTSPAGDPSLIGYSGLGAETATYQIIVDPTHSFRTSPAGDPMLTGYSGLGFDSTMTPEELEAAGYGYSLIPVYEGGVPSLDTRIPVISTNGKTHWEFLKYLAESTGLGRYVHVTEGTVIFAPMEPRLGHPIEYDPNENLGTLTGVGGTSAQQNSAFYQGSIQVRSKYRTSPAGRPTDFYEYTPEEIAMGATDGSQEGVDEVSDNPYMDGRSTLTFIWEKDSQNSSTFPILDISITENYRQKAGKTQAATVDADSKGTLDGEGEPEPDHKVWYQLADDGILGKLRESIFPGVPMLGWRKDTVASSGAGTTDSTTQGNAVGVTDVAPTDRSKINAQKSKYNEAVNDIQSGTKEKKLISKAGEWLTSTVTEAAVKQLSEWDETGFIAGLSEDSEQDELQRTTQGTADANQYGVFLEWSSVGIPGIYARTSVELENLSRWSGATYISRITHKFDTSGGYKMQIKARAPGTFAPTSGATDSENADPDNPSPEQAQDRAAKPAVMRLQANDVSHVQQGTWTREEG